VSSLLIQIASRAERAQAGFVSGNSSVYQTILAELTDATNQASAYPIYGGVYPLGATLGPLIGGSLANIATKYPQYFGFGIFQAYPYFLPGAVCAFIALFGFTLTFWLLDEVCSRISYSNTC
jgi:MFS family permease